MSYLRAKILRVRLCRFVDSSDRNRIDLAQAELKRLLGEDLLADVPLLVWVAKQDLPDVMTPEEVKP
jgi:signal recognition particle receptor subunit beta